MPKYAGCSGDIAAGRDWPRRSAEEIEIAASSIRRTKLRRSRSPSRPFAAGLARSASRVAEWRDLSRGRARASPRDRFARARRLRTATEFPVNKETGGSSDANETNNSPGSGSDWTARLSTPPLAEYWRFIGAWEDHTAQVTEGWALRYRSGAGFELALPISPSRRSAGATKATSRELGASLAVVWLPTDHWRFDLGAEDFAGDTPMRAVLNGITANPRAGRHLHGGTNRDRSPSA